MTTVAIERPRIMNPQKSPNYEVWLERQYPLYGVFSEQMSFLLDYACKAPSSHNSQPWAFRILADTQQVMISPDIQRRLPKSDPTNRELYISVGAAITNMKVAARAFGWDPQVEFVKDDKKTSARITLKPGYVPTPEDKYLLAAINQRVNYGGDYKNMPLSAEVIRTIENVFVGEPDINLTLIRESSTKKRLANLVEEADRAIFSNRNFIQELVQYIRDASTKRKDGVTTTVFGLPKGLRRNARRMLLAFRKSIIENISRIDKDKVENATAIGILTAENESPELWLRIGELYELASLAATIQGVYFGIRAGLIESDSLHTNLETTIGTEQRAQMFFQLGYPAKSDLKHTPRFRASERMEVPIDDEWKVPPADKPTIMKFASEAAHTQFIDTLQPEIIEDKYAEHHLSDLFAALHTQLDPSTPTYLDEMTRFIDLRNKVSDGKWVYYPNSRRLVHVLDEDEFYLVRSASNRFLITKDGQKRIKSYRYGVAGLSSGAEIAWSLVLSGAKYLKLADFDFISGPNHNRTKGETGESKVWNLAWALWDHNPYLELELHEEGITESNAAKFCEGLDLLIEQSDTSSKLRLRQHAVSPVLMITALPNPVVEIELPGEPPFGGRTEAAGVTIELMENISSIAESTAYVAAMIGPGNLTIGNLKNFIAIVNGDAYTYTQTGPDVQTSAGVAGRFVRALAEYGNDRLGDVRSWIVDTMPIMKEDNIEKQGLLREFLETYKRRFGDIQVVKYLNGFIAG